MGKPQKGYGGAGAAGYAFSPAVRKGETPPDKPSGASAEPTIPPPPKPHERSPFSLNPNPINPKTLNSNS